MRRAVRIALVSFAACTHAAPPSTPVAKMPKPHSEATITDAPGDRCTADGDVRLESVVTPGFPPATMRRRVEGTCATLVMSEGDRVGVFRARLDANEVRALIDVVPDAISTPSMIPDMPICSVDLKTAAREVHLLVPLSPPTPQAASLTDALNALDQKLLHRPLQTVRARLDLPEIRANFVSPARVTLVNDGVIAVDVRVEKIVVLSVAKPVATPGVTPLPPKLIEAGSAGASSVHVEPTTEASPSPSIEVDVRFADVGPRIAIARVDLSFDVTADALAPDGSKTIKAQLRTREVPFEVAP